MRYFLFFLFLPLLIFGAERQVLLESIGSEG